jgi:hypothetical protein
LDQFSQKNWLACFLFIFLQGKYTQDMVDFNIFIWIGDLFQNYLFAPFNMLRLDVATSSGGWWTSNGVNWLFLFVLIALLSYWMKESRRFVKEGTEDRA